MRIDAERPADSGRQHIRRHLLLQHQQIPVQKRSDLSLCFVYLRNQIRIDALMRRDIDIRPLPPQYVKGIEIGLHMHRIREFRMLQRACGNQRIAGIQHIIRCPDTDMIDAVPGRMDNAERDTADFNACLFRQNNPVRHTFQIPPQNIAVDILKALVDVLKHDARLRSNRAGLSQREGDPGAVFLPQEPVIADMIDVRMRTQHGRRHQLLSLQQLLQLRALVRLTGIQQNDTMCIQPVKRNQLPAFYHPGISLYLTNLHLLSRSDLTVFRISRSGASPPYQGSAWTEYRRNSPRKCLLPHWQSGQTKWHRQG